MQGPVWKEEVTHHCSDCTGTVKYSPTGEGACNTCGEKYSCAAACDCIGDCSEYCDPDLDV